MGKENIGRYKRTPAMKRKAAKAAKKYWSSKRRSKALKKAWSAKKKSAKMKQVWAEKKANLVPFGKWKPSEYNVEAPLHLIADEVDYVEPMKTDPVELTRGPKTNRKAYMAKYWKAYYLKTRIKQILAMSDEKAFKAICRTDRATFNTMVGKSPELLKLAGRLSQANRTNQEGASALTTLARMQQEAAEGKDTRFRTKVAKDPVALNQLFAIRDLMQTVLKAFDQGITRLEAQVRK